MDNNVTEVDKFEIAEYVGPTQSYYGDTFYKYGEYYMVGYYEEEEDKTYYLYEVYSNGKLLDTSKHKIKDPYVDFMKFVNEIEN